MIAITLNSLRLDSESLPIIKKLSTTNQQSFAELEIDYTIKNSPQLMFHRKYHNCILRGFIMKDFSLTDIFNMSEKEIYYVSNNISKHYKRLEIPKKNNGVRIIYSPNKKLIYAKNNS